MVFFAGGRPVFSMLACLLHGLARFVPHARSVPNYVGMIVAGGCINRANWERFRIFYNWHDSCLQS